MSITEDDLLRIFNGCKDIGDICINYLSFEQLREIAPDGFIVSYKVQYEDMIDRFLYKSITGGYISYDSRKAFRVEEECIDFKYIDKLKSNVIEGFNGYSLKTTYTDLRKLTRLKKLDCSHVALLTLDPTVRTKLTSLTLRVYKACNEIDLRGFNNLRYLNIILLFSHYTLDNNLKELYIPDNLKELYINKYCRLTGNINKLTSLHCPITMINEITIPKSLDRLSIIGENHFLHHNILVNTLNECGHRLKVLHLDGFCTDDKTIFLNITHIHELKWINARHMPLCGLKHLRCLTSLDISNSFSYDINIEFPSGLKYLKLNNTTCIDPHYLLPLKQVEYLGIYSTDLVIPKHMTKLIYAEVDKDIYDETDDIMIKHCHIKNYNPSIITYINTLHWNKFY